jgi:hypothetical protein
VTEPGSSWSVRTASSSIADVVTASGEMAAAVTRSRRSCSQSRHPWRAGGEN